MVQLQNEVGVKSAENYTQPEEVFSACAGAALYRRTFFEVVGYFDENFVMYLEDIDLGLRGQNIRLSLFLRTQSQSSAPVARRWPAPPSIRLFGHAQSTHPLAKKHSLVFVV